MLQENLRLVKIHKEGKWEKVHQNRVKSIKKKKNEVAPGDYEVINSFRAT